VFCTIPFFFSTTLLQAARAPPLDDRLTVLLAGLLDPSWPISRFFEVTIAIGRGGRLSVVLTIFVVLSVPAIVKFCVLLSVVRGGSRPFIPT